MIKKVTNPSMTASAIAWEHMFWISFEKIRELKANIMAATTVMVSRYTR